MKEAICKYLVENGFAAVLDENCLTVEKKVDQYLVEIFHVFPKEIEISAAIPNAQARQTYKAFYTMDLHAFGDVFCA